MGSFSTAQPRKTATSGFAYAYVATRADREPERTETCQPLAGGDAVEDRDPERDRGDHERADTGVDALLGPGHARVSAQEERGADDRGRRPLPAARTVAPAIAVPNGDR